MLGLSCLVLKLLSLTQKMLTQHQKGKEEPPQTEAAGLDSLRDAAFGLFLGVVSGNCIYSSSVLEHKPQTFMGRGFGVFFPAGKHTCSCRWPRNAELQSIINKSSHAAPAFPADGKEPVHATAITVSGSRQMDSIGKFQLSEIKFGFCCLFSAIVNFVSTFKRLDHCVKV